MATDFLKIKEFAKACQQTGEAIKNAIVQSGAVVIMTVETSPDGLRPHFWSFCFLNHAEIQTVLREQFYQKMAQEAEEELLREIRPAGTTH